MPNAEVLRINSCLGELFACFDAVMEVERDLIDVVHMLRQVVCVKGKTGEG